MDRNKDYYCALKTQWLEFQLLSCRAEKILGFFPTSGKCSEKSWKQIVPGVFLKSCLSHNHHESHYEAAQLKSVLEE